MNEKIDLLIESINKLTSDQLVQVGEIYDENRDIFQAADIIETEADIVILKFDDEIHKIPCGSKKVGEALKGICISKAFWYLDEVSKEKWNYLKNKAEEFEENHFGGRDKNFDREKFNQLDNHAAHPIISAIQYPDAYSIIKKSDGHYSLHLFSVPMKGLEDIENQELAEYMLYTIYNTLYQTKKFFTEEELAGKDFS